MIEYLYNMGAGWWLPSIACAFVAFWRTRGWLRAFLATSVVADLLFWWLRNHQDIFPGSYAGLWPYCAGIMALLRVAVTLERAKTPGWPVYAVAACTVHAVSFTYANLWPGFLLQLQIHTVAFVCLLCGLCLLGSATKDRLTVIIAVVFLVRAAGLYPSPWEPDVRKLMLLYESGCYVAIALVGDCLHPSSAAE